MQTMLSFTQQRLVEAVTRGYYVTEAGEVFGRRGRLKISKGPKQAYPTFSTNWGGRMYSLPVHRLAAYCFYGDAALVPGICVRHLNADRMDYSLANIALGTHSDNERDKPKADRKRVATVARAAQPKRPVNAKLTEDQVREIKNFYQQQQGKKAKNGVVLAMTKKYGVSRTVLNKIANGAYYSDV